MIKRGLVWLLAMLMMTQTALAAEEWTGSVTAGETYAVRAAYGGTVDDVAVQAGDAIEAGGRLLTLSGEKIYSPWDGTVAAVFAGEGDDADAAVEKYGAAAAIAPKEKFLVYMTVEEQYRDDDTKRVSLGEQLWMRCAEDGTHRGFGTVIEAEGTTYTIEVTGGQFSNGEVVYAGRVEGYYKSQRVGVGTVLAAETQSVTASGTVVRACAAAGDSVYAGQLLMEVAAGTPVPEEWNGGCVTAQADGIVLSVAVQPGDTVQQGQVLAVLADPGALLVEVNISQSDLALLREGDDVYLSTETDSCGGSVIFISHMADADGGFRVLIRPEDADWFISQTVQVETAADS